MNIFLILWIPAFAGMTGYTLDVIPAESLPPRRRGAGIQNNLDITSE